VEGKILTKTSSNVYRIQVIEKLLNILECFSFSCQEMTLSEITKKTQLNKTTVKRILANLVDHKYLQYDPKTKKYRLWLRFFELGGIVFSSFSLRKATEYYMDYFRELSKSTVLLGVMMENQLVYIDKREGNGLIRITSEIGWRRPLNYGMLGMVLLAYQNMEYVEEILKESPLKAYTNKSITDKKLFFERLAQIRNQGYLIEREEAVEGVIGIAAPIRNSLATTIAAMGIALPIGQYSKPETVQLLAQKLKVACEEISNNIGFKTA